MNEEQAIDLLLRLRNATLNRSVKLHNLLLRFRFLYLLCLVLIWIFLHDLAIALSILIFSFIIYIGPRATHRLIINLQQKMKKSEELNLQYEALWVEISNADNSEKHELAMNKIEELRNKDDDLKAGLKILLIIRCLAFSLISILLGFSAYGMYRFFF